MGLTPAVPPPATVACWAIALLSHHPQRGAPCFCPCTAAIATAAGRFLGPASDQATLPKDVRWLPTRGSQSHPALMPRKPRMIWPQSPSFPFLNYTPTRQALPRPQMHTAAPAHRSHPGPSPPGSPDLSLPSVFVLRLLWDLPYDLLMSSTCCPPPQAAL